MLRIATSPDRGGSGVSRLFPVLPRASLSGELDAAGSLSGSSFYKYIPCAFFCQQKGQNKKKKRWKTSIALLAPLA
jgi:hypothetical protein